MNSNRIAKSLATPVKPKNPEATLSEARARIIWGDSAASVREFLTSNGVSDSDADARIAEYCAERSLEIRRLGMRHTCIGLAIAGGFGAVAGFCLSQGHSRLYGRIFGYCIVGIIYGLWRLSRGTYYLFFTKSEHGSIPDLE